MHIYVCHLMSYKISVTKAKVKWFRATGGELVTGCGRAQLRRDEWEGQGAGSGPRHTPTFWEKREQRTARKAGGTPGERSLEGVGDSGEGLKDPVRSGVKEVPFSYIWP